jgi:glutamyl-tRNA reductase
MARQIFAAEISHEDTPLSLREKLAADEIIVKEHLAQLSCVVDEVFILATCNRFTVYAINNDITPLTNFFAQYPALQGYVQFYYNTEESVTHLFAVASGLLSPIKGDHQIIVQLKEAHQWALDASSIGITLDNLLREAMRVGVRVRTETGIDKFCSSVVDTGIELLYNRLDTLHNKKILIIGTGKIARHALQYLYNEGIQQIEIVSKDYKRASALADQYYVEAVSIEKIHQHVKDADIVIGATHQEISLFSDSFLSGFYDHQKVWFILDFGMPRNFNGKLAEHPAVELYNLDDLKRLYKSPLDAFGGIEAAWTIVMREAKTFMEILVQLEFSPVLIAYWNRLLDNKKREMSLLLPKLENQLSQCDLDKIKKHKYKLMKRISGQRWKNSRVLSNNLQAENAGELVRNIDSFSKIKLNLSIN